MSGPGFTFPFSIGDALGPLLKQLPDGGSEIVDALQERDVVLEDALTFTLSGCADDPTFTAAAGGATITMTRAFVRVPKILICAGDDVGTPPVTYQRVRSADTTSSFKVKVYSGNTEQTSGTYRIVYLAVGA